MPKPMTIKVEVRDPYALHAKMRRAEKFQDKRRERQGQRNWRDMKEEG